MYFGTSMCSSAEEIVTAGRTVLEQGQKLSKLATEGLG